MIGCLYKFLVSEGYYIIITSKENFTTKFERPDGTGWTMYFRDVEDNYTYSVMTNIFCEDL